MPNTMQDGRWTHEPTFRGYVDVIQSLVGAPRDTQVEPRLVTAYRHLICDASLDQALVAKMLQLPSEAYLIELARATFAKLANPALLKGWIAWREWTLTRRPRRPSRGENAVTSCAVSAHSCPHASKNSPFTTRARM